MSNFFYSKTVTSISTPSPSQKSPFRNFSRSIVTVLTMIAGELNYNDVFDLSYDVIDVEDRAIRNLLYPRTAFFVWVVFIILIPILLNNMLVSANPYIATLSTRRYYFIRCLRIII